MDNTLCCAVCKDDNVLIDGCFYYNAEEKQGYIFMRHDVSWPVDAKTVGRYTGINDILDEKIFEYAILLDSEYREWIVRYNKKDCCYILERIESKNNVVEFMRLTDSIVKSYGLKYVAYYWLLKNKMKLSNLFE